MQRSFACDHSGVIVNGLVLTLSSFLFNRSTIYNNTLPSTDQALQAAALLPQFFEFGVTSTLQPSPLNSTLNACVTNMYQIPANDYDCVCTSSNSLSGKSCVMIGAVFTLYT